MLRNMNKQWLKVGAFFLGITVLMAAVTIATTVYVEKVGRKDMITNIQQAPAHGVAIVLGAKVFPTGQLSPVLRDRMDTALDLYKMGKVEKILLTGDHGQLEYDEVNNMRKYALQKGIPAEDIFMDHAGFSTYESMYRAKEVFCVDKALIVTQDFHLPRALYLARTLGLEVKGVPADLREYANIEYLYRREVAARVKAFLEADVLHSKPTYLGEAIPITGDGRVTNDLVEDAVVVTN